MATRDKRYDVIIIGGGLAGLTLSCLLGAGGVSVACLERFLPKGGGDLRTTAISYGSRTILQEAGVWEALEDKACPIEDIRILDGASPVLLNFLSRETGAAAFGWIVLNSDLLAALRARAESLESVDLLAPVSVKGFQIQADKAIVRIDPSLPESLPPPSGGEGKGGGASIEASLVVGADGRSSFVRGWMGVATRGWDYGQRAVICTAAHDNPHHNMAIEHFRPEGPFAVLPMADDEAGVHRSSVVFTEHGPQKNSLMNMSDEAFEIALNARFPDDYGTVRLAGKRACYPLSLIHAADYIAPRMALVADAAHGIHPVAGQGLNLGFRDVAELARLAVAAKGQGEDIGGQDLLATYQRRRRPDNMAMVAVTDALVRLFSNDIPPVRILRKAGLKIVAKLPPAKRFFMRRAMGDF